MKKLKNYTAVPSCTWAYLVLPSPYLPVREAATFLGGDLGDELPSLSRCGGGGLGGVLCYCLHTHSAAAPSKEKNVFICF